MRIVLFAVASWGLSCGTKIGTGEAEKNDLAHYLSVEMPKIKGALLLIGSVQELKARKSGGQPGDLPEFDEKKDLPKMESGFAAMAKIQPATSDLRKVHAMLREGVGEVKQGFEDVAKMKGESKELSDVLKMVKAIGLVFSGAEKIENWQKLLKAGCKANGLEAEYKKFEKEYGLKI